MTLGQLYRSNATRDADSQWYFTARDEIEERAAALNIDPDVFTGIVAALSPQNAWDTPSGKRPNLDAASTFIATGRNVHTRTQMLKAIAIRDGSAPLDALRGPKERSFFLNLSRPGATDAVTVDRWAARAAGAKVNLTPRSYERVADQYRRAAKRLKLSPDALQAAVWAQVRRQAA